MSAYSLSLIVFLTAWGSAACSRPNPDFSDSVDDGQVRDLGTNDLASTPGDLASDEAADLSHTWDLALPSPDLATPRATCDELFGFAPSYTACASGATSCRFYLGLDEKASCAQVCEGLAGTACVGGWDVDSLTCDRPVSPSSCTAKHRDEICECARP